MPQWAGAARRGRGLRAGAIYAAEALTVREDVSVDVLERLPSPYGLVRYGVAPDHLKIKSIVSALRQVLEHPQVRFLGNVDIGVDLTVAELPTYYDAVVVAGGAAVDRRIGVPGEDLPGSFSAREFVAWYNGHPDAALDAFALRARSVAVVGVGNVAVDVARILAKSADELRGTDLPDHVLDVLSRSQVSDIWVLGRRGPAQARFTTKELRELGELAHADVVVRAGELELDEASQAAAAASPATRRNVEVLREWTLRPQQGRPRRLHLRFLLRPVEVLGPESVTAIRLERSRLDGAGSAVGTGETVTVEAQLLLRSVGYRALPLPGLPFDEAAGIIPHAGGRVVRDGTVLPGWYVAGWIKRGPTGVIGTNKADARESVAALLADAPALRRAPVRDPRAVSELLTARGVRVVGWAGWQAIDDAELALGAEQGRERVKIADRAHLLRVAGGR